MSKKQMIKLRKAEERGHADHGWLQSRFSFSFADYYDPDHMGFRALRVINDDIIAAGKGFGMHPHRDMEIVSYVVSGALEHKDNMGNGSVIRPGDVQRMSAGTGVMHSEFNPLEDEPTRLIQIWILPERNGVQPGYEQIHVDQKQRTNALTVIASRDGRDGSVSIHQDATVLAGMIEPGHTVRRGVDAGRHLWIQLVTGCAHVNGIELKTGDGLAISDAVELKVEAREKTEMLAFDLA